MVSMVYGGLDVHKEAIMAHLVNEDTGEIVSEQLVHDRGKLMRAVRRWSKLGELRLCYEASGAGFVLKRWLDAAGVHCDVIAPSLIPKAPGNQVKTDRRDARQLAVLYRAGLLTPVRVPDQEEENARSLVRLREDQTKDCVRLKNRMGKYLRLLGHTYQGASFTLKHRRWVDDLPLESVQRVIVQSYLAQLDHLLEQQPIAVARHASLLRQQRRLDLGKSVVARHASQIRERRLLGHGREGSSVLYQVYQRAHPVRQGVGEGLISTRGFVSQYQAGSLW